MDAANDDAPRGRIHDVLRATSSVVERLELDAVLRRVVEAAMAVVDARYGALGVLSTDGADGALERFIHVGMPETTAAAIGHTPRGEGVLGAVITERRPLRIPHIAEDPRSAGFPAHHPPMDSFLGVPIRVRDEVFGNLYLADAAAGAFTKQDEEIVVGLAATAAIAVENARLFESAQRREAWSGAIADVMGAMLDASGDASLEVVVERVGPLIGADHVTLSVPAPDRAHLRIAHAWGADAAARRGRVVPVAGSLEGRALETRRAIRVAGGEESDAAPRPRGAHRGTPGPTVVLPLFTGEERLGALRITRPAAAPEFSETDLEMAFVFAGQASVAIEVVRGREDRRRLESARDRARIARDLHDHVIQRLYGAGLSLQAVGNGVDAASAAMISTQLDALDDAIKEVRTIILALGGEETAGRPGLRDRLLGVVADVSASLTTAPSLRFSGALDSLVPPAAANELTAALRSRLGAIAGRDPGADADIAVSLDGDDLVLRISAGTESSTWRTRITQEEQ